MGHRRVLFLFGILIVTAVALHPPWKAEAVLARMDYDGFPAIPPRMVTDTARWTVPFAPVYARPTLDLNAGDVDRYQRRLTAGDTSAATEWQRRMESIEKRYRVPVKIRSVWIRGAESGSASGFAFKRSIVSSRFEIDRARLGVHLLAISAIVLIAAVLTRTKASAGEEISGGQETSRDQSQQGKP